jgi:hypothetical protein
MNINEQRYERERLFFGQHYEWPQLFGVLPQLEQRLLP